MFMLLFLFCSCLIPSILAEGNWTTRVEIYSCDEGFNEAQIEWDCDLGYGRLCREKKGNNQEGCRILLIKNFDLRWSKRVIGRQFYVETGKDIIHKRNHHKYVDEFKIGQNYYGFPNEFYMKIFIERWGEPEPAPVDIEELEAQRRYQLMMAGRKQKGKGKDTGKKKEEGRKKPRKEKGKSNSFFFF